MAYQVAKLDQKTDVPICFLPPQRWYHFFVFVIQKEDDQSVKKEKKRQRGALKLKFTLLGWKNRYMLVHRISSDGSFYN